MSECGSRPGSRISGCGLFHRGDPVRDFLGRRKQKNVGLAGVGHQRLIMVRVANRGTANSTMNAMLRTTFPKKPIVLANPHANATWASVKHRERIVFWVAPPHYRRDSDGCGGPQWAIQSGRADDGECIDLHSLARRLSRMFLLLSRSIVSARFPSRTTIEQSNPVRPATVSVIRLQTSATKQVCSSSPFAATQRGNSCPRHRAEGIRQCHHAGWRFDEPAKARDRRHRPARVIRAIDKTVQRSVRARLQQLLDPDHRHLSKSAAAHGPR